VSGDDFRPARANEVLFDTAPERDLVTRQDLADRALFLHWNRSRRNLAVPEAASVVAPQGGRDRASSRGPRWLVGRGLAGLLRRAGRHHRVRRRNPVRSDVPMLRQADRPPNFSCLIYFRGEPARNEGAGAADCDPPVCAIVSCVRAPGLCTAILDHAISGIPGWPR
jgi:hypothetical protein